MSGPDDTTVTVSRAVAALIADAVAEGRYASPSEAIQDALLARKAARPSADDLFGYTADEIERLADEGIASGPGGRPSEDILREAFRRAQPSGSS